MKHLFAVVLLAAGLAPAHELSLSYETPWPAVVVRAVYGGDEPTAYAHVEVFGPGKNTIEFQTGRTDAHGTFAFLPDRDGEWRVLLDDDLGHRQELTIPVRRAAGSPPPPSGGPEPTWRKALTGVSLILGITGIFFWFRARRALRSARP